jgi:hypothetical protein
MASSILRGLLIGAIAAKKIQSVIAKKRNRLVLVFNDKTPKDVVVNFDIIKSYEYRNSVKITSNPVEHGVNINDHRIIEPMTIKLEVGVSNVVNPLNAFTSTQNVLSASRILFTAGFSVANSPMEATYASLMEGLNNGDIFDIETPLRTMKNFLMTSIESTNNSSNYGAFEGIIELQEILMFSSENINTELSGLNPYPNVAGNKLSLLG